MQFNTSRKFVNKRIKLFKEKLTALYSLLCMMKNLRQHHLRLKRLPQKIIRDLRVNPFQAKELLLAFKDIFKICFKLKTMSILKSIEA